MTASPAPDPVEANPPPGLRGRVIIAASTLLARLPEAPLVAAAESLGELWYRVDRRRANRARANLARVAAHLAATGTGPSRVRLAAGDPEALERLLRRAFREGVRYYLEVARAAVYDPELARSRIDIETPEAVEAALRDAPVIVVGAHFGAIELPVNYLSDRMGHAITAPMEIVADPGFARWFVETRSRAGVRVISIAAARRGLLAALRAGESVGMVVDRDLTGGGVPVPFFGHPTPMPIGPALLALETGAPVYVAWCRRTPGLRYRGGMIAVPTPAEGSRRERTLALSAAIAAVLETVIAQAPEQWWAAFQPIWRDLDPDVPALPAAEPGAEAGVQTGTGA